MDLPSNAAKAWFFQTHTTQFNGGLVIAYDERNYNLGNVVYLLRQDFGWATTSTSGNPYINATVTTPDWGQPSQIQKQTTQTLDQYGNLTQMQVYNFGNLSTPVRTYTNTYLTSSSYTSRYMFNRLRQSTVTDQTNTTTLSYVYYDGEPASCGGAHIN